MIKLCSLITYSVILFSYMFSSIQCQYQYESSSNVCTTADKCGKCITSAPYCYWCSDPDFNATWRCNILDRLEVSGCLKEFIIEPKKSFSSKIKDVDLTDITETNSKPIQIKPQEYSIGLSPFDVKSIQFQYRSAENYPLDLYYLMDLTWSMRDDKETLAGLGTDMANALKDLTTDFRLGFGSYAEKPLMPYVNMEPASRINPCKEEDGVCEATTTYKHRLKMTDDVFLFSKIVHESKITGNLDNAEAGMDALMQLLVCPDKIGWRPTSRKIIVFATDSILHFAGDGLLGGATLRNDKRCHLDDEGNFIDDLRMDYPSLEELYRVLVQEKTSVIFAVTDNVVPYYESMKKLLPENIFVAGMTNDSSNILHLIKLGYESIISVIKFEDDSDDDVKLEYFSSCDDKDGPLTKRERCDHIEVGKTYTFTINMTMNQCPRNSKDMDKYIKVSETQLGIDSFVIHTKFLCDCDCERSIDEKSNVCLDKNNSREVCGKCECIEGWSGPNCDCDKSQDSSYRTTAKCRAPNDIQPCSGLGDCLCESCQCDSGYEGTFCECKSCPISSDNNQICGGKSRGICNCGNCHCSENWLGPSCSCSKTHCIAPWNKDNQVCEGRGTCGCDQCKCHANENVMYTGKYCEICYNCTNPACGEYEKCIKCSIEPESCTENSCSSEQGTIYKICDNDKNKCTELETNYCEYIDANMCTHPFSYSIQKDWTVNLKITPRDCVVRAGFYERLSGIGLVLVILILGIILLLLWKCCARISEEREYARFMMELKEKDNLYSGTELNPIYRSPLMTFEVPAGYNRNSRIDDDD